MASTKFDFNKRISVHHIGGRSGSRAFPILGKFEKDLINVLYDADPDCIAQIQERNQNLESELHVLPYCLGDTCKSTIFYINYDPYASSLLETNPDYASYYFFYGDHDHLWSEATKAVEKRDIAVVSIDHIFQSTNIAAPPPDFLSIDTQGSEYEILLGAKETLRSNVVALVIEVEFHSLYKGQKLFGDLVKLLSDQGFDFVRFLGMLEMSPFRAPVGLRGEGFQVSSDALFFRRIDSIEKSEFERYLLLQKLAFIAVIFNQVEYGLQCLAQSKGLVSDPHIKELEELTYWKFLRDLENTIQGAPKIFPQTFASKYTFEASKSRFKSSAELGSPEKISRLGLIRKLEKFLRQIPPVLWLLRQLWHLPSRARQMAILTKSKFLEKPSDVEALLIKYGLKSQAEALAMKRVIQSQFIKKS